MDFLRRLWAVVLGTVAGVILGILFDWLSQNGFVPPPGDGRFIVYPWIAGGAALLGAVIAAILIRSPRQADKHVADRNKRAKRPQPSKLSPRQADKPGLQPGGSEIRSRDIDSIKLDHVEGMPSFDFEAGRSAADKEKKQE